MSNFHPQLEQQLNRYLKNSNIEELSSFLESIDSAYRDYSAKEKKLLQAVELGTNELRIANTEFTTLLEAFPDQIVWIDKNGMVLRIQGNVLDSSIKTGRLFWESNDRETRLLKRRAFEKVYNQKVEIEYATAGEQKQHFEARIYPVVNGRMIALVREITERKHLEETLTQARDAAERADRTKSEFLAVMSHELRTPMNAIIGLSDMLSQSNLDPTQTDLAQTIFESSNVLLAIINDVLDYSKIEAGELKTEKIDFDISALLQEIDHIMMPLLRNKPLQLEFVLEENFPRFIVSDPLRIRQVIMNLLNNAIKFTPRGIIKIEVKSQRHDSDFHAFEICVSDQGIGINQAAMKDLFKPFSQVDSSTTRRFGGTGLGLAISRKIINAMGGEIRCESVEGQGSKFKFTLPLVEGSEDTGTEIGSEDTPEMWELPKEFSVLLVEDNPVNTKVAKAILENLGANVQDAENGQVALDLIPNKKFDLVLMDCAMPVMDGYEATRKIRAMSEPENAIPIVALTANALEGDKNKCLNSGMNDYIAKPLRKNQIQQVLSKWLKTDSPARPS